MIPYIQKNNLVKDYMNDELVTATQFMKDLPEASAKYPITNKAHGGEEDMFLWSCHGLTRTLKEILKQKWTVFDGWFLKDGNQHSWLYHEADDDKYIMDVYPIAFIGGPFIVDVGNFGSPWRTAYIERRSTYWNEEIENFNKEGGFALDAWKGR